MIKRIAVALLAAVSFSAWADFTPGQVLTAAQLNNALAAKPNSSDLVSTGNGTGSGLVGFSQSATYSQNTVGARLQQVVSIKDHPYNAKCDGSTDDYSAVMAAYNAVPAGATLLVPTGTCVFRTAPVFGTKRVSWKGMGARQSVFQYAGPNTTNDAFTFGASGGELNGIRIEGIGFSSATSMTAGAGVHFIKLTRSALRDLLFDHQDGNGNFYHGVWFDGVDIASLDVFQARAKQDAVRINGNGAKADLFLTSGKVASSMVGIHVGGDFGGLQVDTTDIINNATNVLIDKTINTAANNREVFFGPGAMIDTADTTRTATTYDGIGVDIQDTGGFIFFSGTWNATAGTLVRIGASYAGTVKFDAGFMFNAFTTYGGNGRAIDNASSSAEIVINGTRFDNIQGAGLYSSVASSKFILNNPLFNTNVTNPMSSNIATTSRWTYQSGNQSIMGKMAIGSQSQYGSGVSATPDISAVGSNANYTYWGSDAANYWLSIGHSKSGTVGTHTAVVNGDQLGGINFDGSDGTQFRAGAVILSSVSGTPSGVNIPSNLKFRTNNGTATADRVIIDPSGDLRPAGTTTYNLGSASFLWSGLYANTAYLGGRTAPIFSEKLSVAGQVLGTASNSALIAYNPNGQTGVMLHVADAATDQHKVELYSTTAGSFTIRSVDDAYSTSASVLTATRGAGVAWSSIGLNGNKFSLDSSGNALVKATGGLGYGTGAGGTVTQATSKTTGVAINSPTGQITLNSAALAAAATACFTLTDSVIAAADVVNTSIASGATAGAYTLQVDAVAAGSARLCLNNRSAGSLSEAVVINYAVLKGSAN